jgi:hypothetical protein
MSLLTFVTTAFTAFASLFMFVAFLTPSLALATSTCTDTYSKDATIPNSYGAAYNLFSSAKELLVKTESCTDTTASIKIGNGDAGMYVYKQGYYWNNTAWVQKAFTGSSALVANSWYTGSANGTIPLTARKEYS